MYTVNVSQFQIETLKKAVELINHGFKKGWYYIGYDDEQFSFEYVNECIENNTLDEKICGYCMRGAIDTAANIVYNTKAITLKPGSSVDAETMRLAEELYILASDMFPDKSTGYGCLPDFNDHIDVTKDDVVNVMLTALKNNFVCNFSGSMD